jgi:uncharacterized protein (TIGR04255 family)
MNLRRYRKPPVLEAVIEVRYVNQISKADLDRISRRLEGKFPRREEEVSIDVEISPYSVNAETIPTGHKLTSADNLSVVLLRPASITSSKLAPYVGWDVLIKQTESILNDVYKVIERRQIGRIGVRYINRLDIPGGNIKLEDWLNVGLNVPTDFGHVLNEFGGRVVVPTGENLTTALAFQSVPSPLIDHSSVVLDIDVAIERGIPLSDDEVWKLIARMREAKNSVFESCITQRMRDLFLEVEN